MDGTIETNKALFAHVRDSATFGRRSFPTRLDYELAAITDRLASSGEAVWRDRQLAASAARHWHGTGQAGCLFARLLGREADDQRWPIVVMDDVSPGSVAGTEQSLRQAVEEPACDLLSVLFPSVTSVEDLRRLAGLLDETDSFEVFESQDEPDHVIVAVRAKLDPSGLVAWVMAFGPFDQWPATRRGPVLELVMRVKPKPAGIFHKLNQDPKVAHLADIRSGRDEEAESRLYEGSKRATRDVLGGDAGLLGAARTTFSFLSNIWYAAGPTGLPERPLEAIDHPD